MTVGRDRVRQPQLAHDHETGAVGEREVLIAILKEQMVSLFKTVGVYAFPAKPRASLDLLPPGASRVEAESKSDQR